MKDRVLVNRLRTVGRQSYGYRRITIKLREAGWNVGKDRVERIWRECLAIHVRRRINSANLIDVLAEEYIRSDNGPEFVAKQLRKWLARTGAATLYIEPGSPWENG